VGEPIRKIRMIDGTVRYRVVVSVGRTMEGRRAQKTSTHRTLRDARDWLSSVRAGIAGEDHVAPGRLKLNDHLDIWLAGKRNLRPSTRRGYRDALKPVQRALGDIDIQDLTKRDVERVVSAMLVTGGPKGAGRSPRTVTLTLVVLQQALQDAVQQGLLLRNVAALVQRPRQTHREMASWTLDQSRAFLIHVAKDRLRAAWLLTMHGLRRGEVVGLRWTDVSLDGPNPALRIRHTRVLVDGHPEESEPKTARGRRDLPLLPNITSALRDLKAQQRREAELAGAAYENSGLVVVDELGRPLRPEVFTDTFRRRARDAGLPDIRLHDARHTAASLMLELGYPVHVVAAWLGHDPVMTQRVYAHVHTDALRALGSAFDQALSGEQ
jgi:integrase